MWRFISSNPRRKRHGERSMDARNPLLNNEFRWWALTDSNRRPLPCKGLSVCAGGTGRSLAPVGLGEFTMRQRLGEST